MDATDTGILPTNKTPTVVWRATIRISGERLRADSPWYGLLCLSRSSHWSHQPHIPYLPVRCTRAEACPWPIVHRVLLQALQSASENASALVSIETLPSTPTGARDRSQRRVTCRVRAAVGRDAANCPAPSRGRNAHLMPATHYVICFHHIPPLASAEQHLGTHRPAESLPHPP